MGLVTNITKRVDLPGEISGFAVIRKLSWKQLEQAADKQRSRHSGQMREMGGEVLQAFLQARTGAEAVEKVKAVQDAQEKSASNYDRETVLRYGIASWSLSDSPSESLDDLDPETAKFLHEAIVAYSLEVATKKA